MKRHHLELIKVFFKSRVAAMRSPRMENRKVRTQKRASKR